MMVDSMDDGRDFNKARGFLLTYSALVLALWYFGADLTQFKLMGNEIQLHQRTSSVWLVLAGLNVYFWSRCYQRLPVGGLRFDDAMDKIYETSLEWLALNLDRRMLNRKVAEEIASNGSSNQKVFIDAYKTKVTERPSRNQEHVRRGGEGVKLSLLLARYNVRVLITAEHGGSRENGPVRTYHYCTLNVALAWLSKAFTLVRGAFITPWFTDHVAPLVLGAISTGLALWKWWDMNFITKVVAHYPLMCAGVTH